MQSRTLLSLIIVGLVATPFGSAWAQTLRERARQSGGEPVVSGVLGEIWPKSIEDLTAEADVVVIAMLQRGTTALTANEMYLYTPYAMSKIRVIAGALPSLSGAVGKISGFTVIGIGTSEMILEGVLVRSENHNLRDVENGEYLLFLKQWTEAGQYKIYNGAIFAIESDKVRGVVAGADGIYPGINGTPIDQLVSRIQKVRKSR